MGEEWLDPRGGDATLADVVLRRRHEAAYAFARRYADGGLVVDVACGVGYGAGVLGDRPDRYVGIDRARKALGAAASWSADPRASFVRGDVVGGLPIASGSAGAVLAFQIIEHVSPARTGAFLRELRRVCRPDGRVILTTPNRVHRLLPLQPPWNPHHEREFRRGELGAVLRDVFGSVSLRGLRADEDIERVELERVRQRPLRVYGRPLLRMLPGRARRWVEERLFPPEPAGPSEGEPPGSDARDVTVDRFRVEEDPQGRGLDLVAVCRP